MSSSERRDWLKTLRKVRGHSAPWLGGQLGISKEAIYRYESGELNPTPASIFGLARILGEEVIERFRQEHEDLSAPSTAPVGGATGPEVAPSDG